MSRLIENFIGSAAFLFAVALSLSLTGCAIGHSPDLDNSPVDIQTRAAIGSEIEDLTIGSVRILAADALGNVVFNDYKDDDSGGLDFTDGGLGADKVGNFSVNVLPGVYTFYAVVNETSGLATVLDGVVSESQLGDIHISTALSEADMICFGKVSGVRVRAVNGSGDAVVGQVSVDGVNWGSSLNVEVTRIAAKLTVLARKAAGGDVTITGGKLDKVPSEHHLQAHAHDVSLVTGIGFDIPSGGIALDPDGEDYVEIVSGHIMPEYLMASPTNENDATQLSLTAEGGKTYNMTLLGDGRGGVASNPVNFSIERGKHYNVKVSLSDKNSAEITYTVDEWESVTSGTVTIDNDVITTNSKWAAGTVFEGATVVVNNNGSVTYEFILANPTAEWTAHISNTVDFELSGDTSGFTREGEAYSIVIRPRAGVEESVYTEFFITVDDGVRDIEVDLNSDGTTGAGNRYVIRQIPSL
ncbi:MAG: hypothetical protein LBV38_05975 [Alistipes sp.]|jgi:hypothetical protein|nr:hypothetical protein [Alistipes sp.]